MKWTCPKCGYKSNQPSHISGMAHPCVKNRGKPVEMKPEKVPTPVRVR